mmetsp:Transcript_16714/g.27103  ORF Transcript_16714/g.27103 Transcript_16714/m.27103 type:complete len:428 (+) Transcript_16714:255-1538(+)|eukprot:CAMPEP_0203763156 /NCGR_PEP_ID=MMETSP0098-20131031/15819_1 /ASSEMBLY_ACC=CAM_ASM_000208 /TAXON_ID=96639 /ORGANISM=" , Strain NY0313808BC1" /LENGTH=427 /DNA_ID=CAMNT_0050657765 /DNA_START=2691 /DNA_END=3974 /DNA_ORIENTATION=+
MGRFSLDGYTDKCVRMLNDMVNPKYVKADKQIPATLLRHCEGVAFITIWKAGMFFLGANAGGGCVVAKIKDESEPRGWRWSGPTSVACGGLGGGFIFGGEKIDSLIILNTKGAVRAFMGKGQVTFGGNLSLAAGPVGRDMEGHIGVSQNKEIVAAYSYSKAQGLYIGATLEGAFLAARNDDNKKYYGDPSVTPEKILAGEVNPPLKVDALHRELYAIHERRGDYKSLESSKHLNTGGSGLDPNSQSMAGMSGGDAEQQLAPNWRKVFTADGKAYYHNTVTNETAWEAPLAEPPRTSMGSPPVAKVVESQPFQNAPSSASSYGGASNSYGGASSSYGQPPVKSAYGQPPVRTASGAVIPPRPGSMRPVPPSVKRANALYDYVATRPDELSFKANESLVVIDKTDQNWWKCKSPNGATGLAPSNYLREM